MTLFNRFNLHALVIQNEGRHSHRQLDNQLGDTVFGGFFFNQAQYRQAQRLHTTHMAKTGATRADFLVRLAQSRTQALTRHFQQTKTRNTTNLNPGTIGFQVFTQAVFNITLVTAWAHIDKVDNDQTTQIAQT
jgi:hypothetical protein